MRKTVRRATIVLALTPVMSIPTTMAFAITGPGSGTTAVSTPAPSGDASAVAAEVKGVVSVGKTAAHAGSDGGSADADALTVLGDQLTGGSQKGAGTKSGSLFATGTTPVGDAEVAPWTASVANKDGGSQSAAEAALAHANLANAAEVWLLHSTAAATWTPLASTGDSVSDGAEVSALGLLDIKVLHADAHSTGKGRSDLLVINGNEIGSSDQFNGACSLDIPAVLNLVCLTASGGLGTDGVTSAAANVAAFDIGSGALAGPLSGAASSAGKSASAPASLPQPAQAATSGSVSSPAHIASHTPASAAGSGSLPFTGADTLRLLLLAMVTSVVGGCMALLGRRRQLTVRV